MLYQYFLKFHLSLVSNSAVSY